MMNRNKYIKLIILGLVFVFPIDLHSQDSLKSKNISDASFLFKEVKRICDNDGGELWGENLFSKAILTNIDNRFFVANDSLPIDNCARKGMYFIGYLPNIYPMANSTLKVGTKKYASIRYSDKNEFDTLLYIRTFIHEMFHVFMSSNNYDSISYNNPQMDKRDGRVYLQLELLALKKALISNGVNRKEAIKEALCFRNKRQSLFPNSKANENNFEIQEGLAQYTEYSLAIFSERERMSTLLNSIDRLIKETSYMRSFGYETGASYAFLNDISNDWRKTVFIEKDLSKITMNLYGINNTEVDTSNLSVYIKNYDYKSILLKEDSIEGAKEIFKLNIIERFNNGVLLVADLEDNSFSIISNMIQLDSTSTYFPYIKLTGKFGYINSKKEAIINWSKNEVYFLLENIIVENNKTNSNNIVVDINKGWRIEKRDRQYKLVKY